MTLPFAHHRAGFVLRCVLVLVAVLVSSLCAAGQSAAESVRTEPAFATADARPAAGFPGNRAAAEPGSDAREAAALHEAATPSSADAEHCGGQAGTDTAATRDGSRPSAPPATPEHEERRTASAPAGPGPASAGPESPPPAPDPVRLSVLRI